jgi:hypothetical protein
MCVMANPAGVAISFEYIGSPEPWSAGPPHAFTGARGLPRCDAGGEPSHHCIAARIGEDRSSVWRAWMGCKRYPSPGSGRRRGWLSTVRGDATLAKLLRDYKRNTALQ